ncbi:hypothetical protein [Spirosoma telluris]|uniref:hypothetical protein n=1 Tax=Spirosoma telluris TaxID=2183553 RepID=UPI002FC31E31
MKITAFMMHMVLTFFLLIGACSTFPTGIVQVNNEAIRAPDKVLIVYLSRTNNTKALAKILHKHVGGTLVALELSPPTPPTTGLP